MSTRWWVFVGLCAGLCAAQATTDASLAEWLAQSVSSHKLDLTDAGAFARDEIEAGEEIFSVGLNLCLTPGAARASAIGDAILSISQPVSEFNVLVVYLL